MTEPAEPAEPAFLTTTRSSYDAVAGEYAALVRPELATKVWDRAVLGAFAETVRNGPVLDVGCGPGRVTAHLRSLGVDVSGLDLSPAMVALASAAHRDVRFAEGSMTALDHPDGSLAGIVAWYSTIHVPDDELPAVFAGFHRVLAAGGHLLLAFQVGDDTGVRTEAFGHDISLTFHRRRPDRVLALLVDAGFEPRARLVREPEEYPCLSEKTAQAYVLVRKSLDGHGQ